MTNNDPIDISRLIAAKLLGRKLTDKEEQRLEQWLLSDEKNRTAYERAAQLRDVERMMALEEKNYGRREAARFVRHLHEGGRRSILLRMGTVAAAAVLLLGVLFWWHRSDTDNTEPQMAESNLIVPGQTSAVLTLADGRQLDVCRMTAAQVDAVLDSVTQSADARQEKADAVLCHTLTIPRGGEYHCTLPDGTQVWLNAESQLRFPETFSTDERRVALSGEAFFDVSHETGRPFIVDTERGNITVYGTRFCLTAYTGNPLAAVLVNGSIGFRTPTGEEVKLRPSDRLTYDDATGSMSVRQVDTSLYTAWLGHRFAFRDNTLEDIMTSLARWYDFTPRFDNEEARHIRLSGQLGRREDIRTLLHSFELTADVKFHIQADTIIITSNH